MKKRWADEKKLNKKEFRGNNNLQLFVILCNIQYSIAIKKKSTRVINGWLFIYLTKIQSSREGCPKFGLGYREHGPKFEDVQYF